MLDKLYYVSTNEEKIKEARAILGFPIESMQIEADEIQDLDIENIVQKKAAAAYTIVRKPLLVDDAGLYIHAWNGFPGPFVKYIMDSGGSELFLRMLSGEKDRSAYYRVAIGYHDGKDIHVFTGEAHGKITLSPRGTKGWGYDPIFQPEGYIKTFGELSPDEKNSISHRRKALEKLKIFLNEKIFIDT